MVEITEEMRDIAVKAYRKYGYEQPCGEGTDAVITAIAPLIEAQVIQRCVDAEPDHEWKESLGSDNIAEFALRWIVAMDDMASGDERKAQVYREWRTKQIEAQVIERCAKVAEERSVSGDYDDYWGIPAEVAGAIRALIAHPRAASENTCEDPS